MQRPLDQRELKAETELDVGKPQRLGSPVLARGGRADAMLGWLIALVFGATLCLVAPLWTALRFGSDEGYELMKAFLVSLGHPLYTEVWNDQPPLHTEMVALLFRSFGPSAGAAWLLTVAFAVLYLAALYRLVARHSGRGAAAIATILAGTWPIFLRLAVSVMLELPAMALALASAWALSTYLATGRRRWTVASGALFGCALQVKFTAAIFLPAIALELLAHGGQVAKLGRLTRAFEARVRRRAPRQAMSRPGLRPGEPAELEPAAPDGAGANGRPASPVLALLLWGASAVLIFGAIALAFCPLDTFKVFWLSHFSRATLQSATARGGGFDARSLLGCLCLAQAAAGIAFIVWKRRWELRFPVALAVTVFGVHLMHRPYWYYYELHFVAPLAWLAAVGVSESFQVIRRQTWPRTVFAKLRVAALLLGWSAWVSWALGVAPSQMLETLGELRSEPSAAKDARVLALDRAAAATRWVFTDDLICAFWAHLPVPPELGVIPLKRIWSGQISHTSILACLRRYRPEQILLETGWEREFRLSRYIRRHYRPASRPGLFVRKDAPTPSP
jgi:Dolichyl-phosphate-mannose-protein mannosyltransferase